MPFLIQKQKKIDKKSNVHLHGSNSRVEEYLYITTKINEFKVLISTTLLVGEEYRDISDYLLNKNPNIKVNSIQKTRYELNNNEKITLVIIGLVLVFASSFFSFI